MSIAAKSPARAALATTIRPGLIALQAPGRLSSEGAMPTRLLMLKWGTNETAIGPKVVGLKTLAASRLWDQIGFGRVAIDFNHNTVPGHPSYKGEPAKIAGMATPRVIQGEGLVFEDIEWTPEGIESRGHYPDLSPAVKDDASGEVLMVHSGALARNGAVKDLHLFSADSTTPEFLAAFQTLSAQLSPTAKTMIKTDLLKQLLALNAPIDPASITALSADATDDDINQALQDILTASQKKPADPETGDVKTMSATLLKAINGLGAKHDGQIEVLTGQIKTLNARLDGQTRDAIVDAAIAEGREVPKAWLPNEKGEGGLPLGELKTLCATLPITVPLERRTPKNIITLSADASGISATEREVMQQLGLTEEQWKKHA